MIGVEIYDLVDALHSCKQAPGKSVSTHVLKMKGYMDQLHALGKSYDNDMAINLINRSLNKDFGDFVSNFNMHCVGKTVTELHALLIDYEKGLKDKAPTPQVLTIQKGRENKPKPQANKKDKSKGKTDKNKKVLDTGRGTAIFTSKNCEKNKDNKDKAEHGAAGLEERKLSYRKQYLQVGNGAQAAVEAIGVFDLVLPSGLVLKLNNCYYAPSIVRGVVSLSCLLALGFNHTIASNGIYVSLNGLFYFSVVSMNGVFEIDMNNNVLKNNHNSIFSINKKRKLDLDSSYLWHCRLAYIGKTCVQKLQREGLLESINDVSFDKCESCISRKITKKPFNNNIERATDLLGLIHTDVYGPLKHVSRKGASYFLTFTDDFSQVELQLGKKIKALRFDRGGEYLSQEFKDYLQSESLGSPPELIPVCRPERTTCAPNRLCLNREVEDDEVGDLGKPANYNAAMLDPDKVVRSRWLYKKKTDMDSKVHTYKARLVAKGCTQTYGINYNETFSPVADIRAIRILIAIAAYYDYE
nr:hypothetical protein [Tanacetum cinerariifolium]